MAAKSSLCRRTIPEILKPEGAAVEWRLIAWGWMVRRISLLLSFLLPHPSFLLPPSSFLLVLFLSGCASLAPVREKVGVLAHTDISWPNSTVALKLALAFYRAENVDRIVFLGDPTKDGYKNQWEIFEQVWNRAFKGVTPPKRVIAEEFSYEIAGIGFTGHGRLSLTDLFCVEPRNGKLVNAGSMHGITTSGVFNKSDASLKGRLASSAQGLLVLVRSGGMTIRRLDFSAATVEDVGAAWEIKDGLIEAEGLKPPEFWSDTRLSVIKGYDKQGGVIYTLRWPPILAKFTGERAFSYDILVGDRVVGQAQSNGFYLPESRDKDAVVAIITEAELNGEPPRFGVTPVSSLGKTGRTLR